MQRKQPKIGLIKEKKNGSWSLANNCYPGYYRFAFRSKKIPELAQGIGKGIKTFKKEMESGDEATENKTEKVEKKDENKA